MTRLVIDSGVAIKWFITEPQSIHARIILSQYQTGHLSLVAPDAIYTELANILWRKQKSQRLAVRDGQSILDTFRALRIPVYPPFDLLDSAYELASRYHQSVHSMLYLALSQRERCKYVTADEEFSRLLHTAYPDVIALIDWK